MSSHRFKQWIIGICFALSVALAPGVPASEVSGSGMTVVIAYDGQVDKDHDGYFYRELMELALAKTVPTHGPYAIKLVPVISNENRLLRAIEQGRVDLTWMPYDKNISASLQPIKISLHKDVSNYRLLLIRRNDQQRFSRVRSLGDLRQLRGGMGAHWPDRMVMEANGLPLVVSVSYPNLFKMLAAGRFDYFSRGIYQISPEVEQFAGLGLALETDLMLYYENPIYFYVNKNNDKLAQRLEQGLLLAMSDGSFDALYASFPRFLWALDQLAQKRRQIIKLQAAGLPD